MKKIILSTTLCLLLTLAAKAQTDSTTFVKANWETKTIAPGLILKHFWFNKSLFDTNENVSILEVDKRKKLMLILGYEKQTLKPVRDFGTSANALAAINGGFFDVKNGGAVDYIKSNGEVITQNHLDKNNKRAVHQNGAITFKKGRITIRKWNGNADWESGLNGDVMDAGPILIYHKKEEMLDTSIFVKKRHPRTAIVVTRKHTLLITIDGRNEKSAGVNLYELAKISKWLGAKEAINMDGGGSTTMWVKNEPDNGVVNYPCDNKKWDHGGDRKVANVVLIKSN